MQQVFSLKLKKGNVTLCLTRVTDLFSLEKLKKGNVSLGLTCVTDLFSLDFLFLPGAGDDSEEAFNLLAFLLDNVWEVFGDLEAFWTISSTKESSSPSSSSSSSSSESKTDPGSTEYCNFNRLYAL